MARCHTQGKALVEREGSGTGLGRVGRVEVTMVTVAPDGSGSNGEMGGEG